MSQTIIMPTVNPEILIWARETAGLSLDEAAHAIQLKDAHGKNGADRLAAIEAGEAPLSRPVLLRMAEKYRRSLLVFYLDRPPRRDETGQDFRTVPGEKAPYDAQLEALIRDIKVRQSLVKSLLEDEETPPHAFVGSMQMRDGTAKMAEDIISVLDFSLTTFRARRDYTKAFQYLRQCVEDKGIFVMLLGDLGHSSTQIGVETFRGFVIADVIAPFIVVNTQDSASAKSFTLLHEVTHVWLGTTGISGGSDEVAIERFCNEVAGTILIPAQELSALQNINASTFEQAVTQISEFASQRNVSRAMVSYKLFKAGQMNEVRWRELNQRFEQERAASKQAEKDKKAEDGGGGPNYYVLRRQRLGSALLGLLDRSLNSGAISPTKAAKILGVKPRSVAPLLSYPESRGES